MKRTALLLISMSIGIGSAVAVPSISGVSGVFNNLETITIAGSGMGSHPDFNGASHSIPDHLVPVWKDFEDSTLISDGITSIQNNHTQSWILETTGGKVNSGVHGKRIFFAHGDNVDRISGLQKFMSGTTGNFFFSYWFWWPSLENITLADGGKQFRIYGSGTAANIYVASAENSSSMQWASECHGGCSPDPALTKGKAGGYKLGEWQRIDAVMSQNPSQMVMYRNMQKFYCASPSLTGFTNCVNQYAEQYVYNPFGGNGHDFLFGHMIDSPGDGGDNGYYRMDDLYADYTLAHVELCSKPTWNELITGGGTAANKCEVQIPKNWASTQVAVSFNPGSFTTGQTAYLYVISDGGTPESFDVNPTGFPVVIGQTGSGTAIGQSEGDITGVAIAYEP